MRAFSDVKIKKQRCGLCGPKGMSISINCRICYAEVELVSPLQIFGIGSRAVEHCCLLGGLRQRVNVLFFCHLHGQAESKVQVELSPIFEKRGTNAPLSAWQYALTANL